jgi:hypothetical protein
MCRCTTGGFDGVAFYGRDLLGLGGVTYRDPHVLLAGKEVDES